MLFANDGGAEGFVLEKGGVARFSSDIRGNSSVPSRWNGGGLGAAPSSRRGAAVSAPNGAREALSYPPSAVAKRYAGVAEGDTLFDGITVIPSVALLRLERGAVALLSDDAFRASSEDLNGAAYENAGLAEGDPSVALWRLESGIVALLSDDARASSGDFNGAASKNAGLADVGPSVALWRLERGAVALLSDDALASSEDLGTCT